MKHHSVIARVDAEAVFLSVNGKAYERLPYNIEGLIPLTNGAGDRDLMEILEFFLTLYASDRLIPRSKWYWPRSIDITFPVTSVARWNDCRQLLEQLIWQSTGDIVAILPVPRPKSDVHVDVRATRFVLEHEQPVSVIMLSEGLDSLCGAFQAARSKQELLAFVSIVTNSRKRARLNELLRGLKEALASTSDLRFHHAHWHLEDSPSRQERTQRARTMLAIATGLTVACSYGTKRVIVSENGMGILNLPNPLLQTLHESSQVLHPSNLSLWEQVSKQMLNGATIAYPNRFYTKAQMCLDIPDGARRLIGKTSSCDAPPRINAQADCGLCGSCQYRRSSLAISDLLLFDTDYAFPQSASAAFDPLDLQFRQAVHLRRCLEGSSDMWKQWDALTEHFPTLQSSIIGHGVGERTSEIQDTIMLIERHVSEMARCASGCANAV